MYLSLCTKFLYSEYKKCPQTFPRSLFTLTLHTVLPSLGIWFSSFTCLIIHWTLAPDQALFLEIAGLKTNKAQPWSLHSGIVNLKFQGNMLVWGSVQVLWGHAVQPGRVRGDLTEQVKSVLGLGGQVGVYILGKWNSMEKVRDPEECHVFQ